MPKHAEGTPVNDIIERILNERAAELLRQFSEADLKLQSALAKEKGVEDPLADRALNILQAAQVENTSMTLSYALEQGPPERWDEYGIPQAEMLDNAMGQEL